MYRNFFSLSELPFSISPDPKYLYMSDRHREALTHLTYGLGDVGGFALLTGEVGTGKTTISRCLMEQLPENTQAAFILNPTLSSQELLATLCDELKIRYRKTGASLKSLTDKISEKLLKNHGNDINTLLIIDEAQHLQPEVLEQLRLLTNLETNTKKLLQVILIGQPELQQLLQRRDLRQLAQRITARYHLMPLTKQELTLYIQHRLTVADCARAIFDKAALAKIHQLSQGIPRLTNLLCHSALMLAYNQNDSVVNKKTVVAAAERALGEDLTSKSSPVYHNRTLLFTTAFSMAASFALAGFWWGQTQQPIDELVITNTSKQSSNTEEKINLTVDKNILAQAPVDKEQYLPQIILGKNKADLPSQALNVAPVTTTTNNSKNDDMLAISENDSTNIRGNNKASLQNNVKQEPVSQDVSPQVVSVQAIAKKEANQENSNRDVNFQVTKVAGVSNDLLARFQAAIDDTENKKSTAFPDDFSQGNEQLSTSSKQNETNFLTVDANDSEVRPLSQMSQQFQNALPSLQFEQHIYASDGQGWVMVNGRDRYEGDFIGEDLIVEKILPQQVILSFQGELFSLPALTNW